MGEARSVLSAVACVSLTALVACAQTQYRVSVAPSLRPVDSARPMVVFRQVQGEACGRDAVLGAIRDMKRLSNVDGYIEVVVEDLGEDDERCAKVTAYPFRYCTDTSEPGIVAAPESLDPVVLPGRADACAESIGAGSVDCNTECGRIAALVEPAAIQQALIKDRCSQRCSSDAGFAACLHAATTQASASACLATEPAAQAQEMTQ